MLLAKKFASQLFYLSDDSFADIEVENSPFQTDRILLKLTKLLNDLS